MHTALPPAADLKWRNPEASLLSAQPSYGAGSQPETPASLHLHSEGEERAPLKASQPFYTWGVSETSTSPATLSGLGLEIRLRANLAQHLPSWWDTRQPWVFRIRCSELLYCLNRQHLLSSSSVWLRVTFPLEPAQITFLTSLDLDCPEVQAFKCTHIHIHSSSDHETCPWEQSCPLLESSISQAVASLRQVLQCMSLSQTRELV